MGGTALVTSGHRETGDELEISISDPRFLAYLWLCQADFASLHDAMALSFCKAVSAINNISPHFLVRRILVVM